MTNTEIKLAKELVSSLVDSLIRDGHFKPDRTSNEELQKKTINVIKQLAASKIKIKLCVDHTTNILKRARNYASNLDYNASCIFYAMWIEHWVNRTIHSLCLRANISSKHKLSMIRETSLHGKLSWLLAILGFPTINSIHQKRILNLAELRNSYIHYKWSTVDRDKEISMKEAIGSIESTIKYLQRLERKFIYKDKKTIVKTIPKKMQKNT